MQKTQWTADHDSSKISLSDEEIRDGKSLVFASVNKLQFWTERRSDDDHDDAAACLLDVGRRTADGGLERCRWKEDDMEYLESCI